MKQTNKSDAIRYVIEHPSGKIRELREVIGSERLLEFSRLRYIRKSGSSYHSTDELQKDYDAFYKKQGVWMTLKSILFGCMAKMFVR